MGRNIANNNLDKKYLLSKVSQITIFAVYTGIDISVIQDCIDNGKLISSPFRIDNHPSFGFRYDNRNKLKARDFAGYFWGDCFDAAALVMSSVIGRNIDINKSNDFRFILNHIAYTFRDIIYGKEKDENSIIEIGKGLEAVRNTKNVIEIVNRSWNESDKRYWGKFGINFSILNTNYVYPVEQYYINRYANPQPKYFYDKKDPCYAYILGQDKYGIYNVKLYFPKRDKHGVRFITNCNHIEGILNFDNPDLYDYVIITKSTKDRLAIKSYMRKSNLSILYGESKIVNPDYINVGIVNIPAENYKLKQKEYDYIRSKLKPNGLIISLMDNDRTGYSEAIYLKEAFNIIPIVIPKKYEAKDFAELCSLYSIETIDNLVIETYNYIKEIQDENIEIKWNTEKGNTMPF